MINTMVHVSKGLPVPTNQNQKVSLPCMVGMEDEMDIVPHLQPQPFYAVGKGSVWNKNFPFKKWK